MTGLARLYLFQVATDVLPGPEGPIPMSAGCYLLQTGDGRNILIDSGMPADYEHPAGASTIVHGEDVVAQLARLGLQPTGVDTVVCTHLDVDHAGCHDAFPRAEFVVQRAQYEAARSGAPRYARARPHWDDPALRYRLIDGDVELLPGLTLLETSGHTAGHQSVLVRLPRTGPVLLAIDAVPLQRLFVPDRPTSPLDEDEAQMRASTRKLLEIAERERVALVVFHHDGAQWEGLRKAPEWYG
jgi:N-acyl homoserine lactone hydrolase